MTLRKAFTLIEITAVLAIVAIIAAIAIPNYSTYVQQQAAQAAQNNLKIISAADQNYYYNHGSYCVTPSSCDTLDHINTSLGLNISDHYYTYKCDPNGSGFNCNASGLSGQQTLTCYGGGGTPYVCGGTAGVCTSWGPCTAPSCTSTGTITGSKLCTTPGVTATQSCTITCTCTGGGYGYGGATCTGTCTSNC